MADKGRRPRVCVTRAPAKPCKGLTHIRRKRKSLYGRCNPGTNFGFVRINQSRMDCLFWFDIDTSTWVEWELICRAPNTNQKSFLKHIKIEKSIFKRWWMDGKRWKMKRMSFECFSADSYMSGKLALAELKCGKRREYISDINDRWRQRK